MQNNIGNIIFRQLGGNKFIVMTGAKNFICGSNFLQFYIPARSGKPNFIKISLNGNDLYDVEFGKLRAGVYKKLDFYYDIYNDSLVDLFEDVTGLYTKL